MVCGKSGRSKVWPPVGTALALQERLVMYTVQRCAIALQCWLCTHHADSQLKCAKRVAGRASPGQTGIAARRVSSANTPGNRLSHLVSSSDSRVSTHSVHEGLCIFAALERTEGSTGANLQRHVFRSRALMTCTLARPQRRARFVLSETFYVPPGQDPCHLVRQLQHEQLQNHSYSVLYQQAPARLQATPRRQKQHTLLISQPVQRRLI